MRSFRVLAIFGVAASSILFAARLCFGQMDQMPVVTIQATDNVATRTGDPGEFTVFRRGNMEPALNVYYRIYGTAENGVDYEKISNWVTIPAGAPSAVVRILPIDHDQQLKLQTVILQLDYSPLMPPVNYMLGEPSRAELYITDGERPNLPPLVRLVMPPNGATFPGEADIILVADARDPDPGGFVDTVEFFAGTRSLGVKTNNPLSMSPMNPFVLVWSNVPPGQYTLTAKATDNLKAVSRSEPVVISVFRNPDPVTRVGVLAVQPDAAEPCEGTRRVEGKFTVFRSANTNIPLTVQYEIRGSAINGTDYREIRHGVVIPEGQWSADIVISPLADDLAEGTEAVGLQVVPPPCIAIFPPPPECYIVGRQSQAVVWIRDCQTPPPNQPPVVRMAGPANGAIFRSPVDVPLFAYAKDLDGTVEEVEFFAGDRSLGLGKSVWDATRPSMTNPNVYWLVWSDAPVGSWSITAKATDNLGDSTVSEPINISILDAPLPPTDRPNVVSIVATDPVAIEGDHCWPRFCFTDWAGQTADVFTLCGPKNALFTIRRMGPTNEALTVQYSIGGTAKNGVDYVELPGKITVPAGERRALIPIIPLDAEEPDTNLTVALRLTPSDDYIVGRPAAAAAIIINSEHPRWVTDMLPGGLFHLNASGPDGAWFSIEFSTNMVDWTSLSTNQVVNGSIDFIDPDASADRCGFYRAVPQPVAPAE